MTLQTCVRPFLFVCLACAVGVFAQGGESTQILGIVEDTSGAIVPGVPVTVTHVATGQQRQVTTGESGNYVFTNIAPASTPYARRKRDSNRRFAAGLLCSSTRKRASNKAGRRRGQRNGRGQRPRRDSEHR